MDGIVICCPRCDKPLSPDHRCGITRRVLFGIFAGATAAMAMPDVWGSVICDPWTVKPGSIVWHLHHAIRLGVGTGNGANKNQPFRIIGGRDGFDLFNATTPGLRVVEPVRPFWQRRQS